MSEMDFYNEHITLEFDKAFSGLELTYLPWVGRNFVESHQKLMILAESVYDWKPGSDQSKTSLSNNKFVRNCVKEHGLNHTLSYQMKTSPLYRNVERMLENQDQVSNGVREEIWESVAFHQYVQRPMSNRSERPNKNDYVTGASIIKELLNILNPDILLLLGSDYNKSRAIQDEVNGVFHTVDQKVGRYWGRRILFEHEGDRKMLIAVKHPSSHFSWSGWASYYREKVNSFFG